MMVKIQNYLHQNINFNHGSQHQAGVSAGKERDKEYSSKDKNHHPPKKAVVIDHPQNGTSPTAAAKKSKNLRDIINECKGSENTNKILRL